MSSPAPARGQLPQVAKRSGGSSYRLHANHRDRMTEGGTTDGAVCPGTGAAAIKPQQECCHGFCALLPVSAPGSTQCWQVKRPSDRPLFALAFLATLTLVVGIIAPVVFDKLLDDGIDKNVVIDGKNAPAFDSWEKNTDSGDMPINYEVYAFDIVNPETAARGEKPILVERGPYFYHEYRWHFDIEWSDGGNIMTFYTWTYYIFDNELSYKGAKKNADEEDIITQVYMMAQALEWPLGQAKLESTADGLLYNMDIEDDKRLKGEPTMGMATMVGDSARASNVTELDWISKLALCSTQYEDPGGITPFRDLSVHDLYWGYWDDPILVALKSLITALNTHLEEPIDLSLWTTSFPGLAANLTDKDDTRRRTNVDVVKTGKHNIENVFQYELYQNMSKMYVCIISNNEYSEPWDEEAQEWPACAHFQSEWDDETAAKYGYNLMWNPDSDWANRISGTDASLFKHVVHKEKELEVFIDDIYRSAWIEYYDTVKDFHHVKLLRYGLRDIDLENATIFHDNYWFNQFGPKGISNFTNAAGMPFFASKPHFLDGDRRLIYGVDGLMPIRDAHDTYLDIEPQTGATMRAHKRLQVNNYLESTVLPAVMIPDALEPVFAVLLEDFLCIQAFGGDRPSNFREECDALKAGMPNFVNVTVELEECMSTPSSWHVSDDAVYIPYAWADENFKYNSDDVDDFKNDVYGTEEWESQLQFWCFVASGALFLAMATLLGTRALVRHEHGVDPYDDVELMHHRGHSEENLPFLDDRYESPRNTDILQASSSHHQHPEDEPRDTSYSSTAAKEYGEIIEA